MDVIYNGQASGSVAGCLMQHGFDPRGLRPYVDEFGSACVDVTNRQGEDDVHELSTNANATLLKDEWKQLDEAVVSAGRERLNLVADLRGSGLVYNVPNGMGKTVLETQTASETEEAKISMDGIAKSPSDRQEFGLNSLPLPIIHFDFHMSLRQVQAGRNSGAPLDTSMAEQAGRRVAEQAERLATGAYGTFAFGGGTVYGLRNFPSRNTGSITTIDGSWTPDDALNDVLAMRAASIADNHYGPWRLYCGPTWDSHLEKDYTLNYGGKTLRQRLLEVEGIQSVTVLDYLTTTDLVLVQQTSDVVREVIGMDLTTVQWETQGGMMQHMKVLAIMVPQPRADYNANCGIVHYS